MPEIEIKAYTSAQLMLNELGEWLEENAANNNLLLGFLYRLARREAAGGEVQALMVAAISDGKPKMAFLQTPPRELMMVSDSEGWEPVLQLAVEEIKRHSPKIMGIIGPEPQVSSFVGFWGGDYHRVFGQNVMQLDHLVMPKPCKGTFRLAEPNDADQIRDWFQVFFLESLQQELSVSDATQLARAKILEKSFWVWEVDGQVVSMGGVERPTRSGITVVLVYTPAKARGNGYASNLVAELTALQLRKGRSFCCLHTDSDNPTSNKIYKAMGYYEIGQGSLIHFDEGLLKGR